MAWYDSAKKGQLPSSLSFLDPAGFLSGKGDVNTNVSSDEAARTRGLATSFADERKDYVPQTGAQDQTRGQQEQSLGQLQAAAAGQVPSAAEQQLKRQTAVDTARQFGLASALRGHSPGSALRTASEGAASITGQANNDAATLRANEQANARGQLAGALQGVRGQDITQQQTNDAWRKALLDAQIAASGQSAGTVASEQAAEAARAAAATQKQGGFLSAGGSIIGALSDERAKKNIKPKTLADALADGVHGVEFIYRPGADDGGKHVGVIAQEVERVIPGVVKKDATGMRRVDSRHLTNANTAAISELARRLRDLEEAA